MSIQNTIRPWSENIWFSPCYVIGYLNDRIASGMRLNDPDMKAIKESWVGAVMAGFFSRDEGVEWWIQIPKQDPPDVIGMKLVPRTDKGQDLYYTNFEVFEITKFNSQSIVSQIKDKLKNKDYSKTLIVGYVIKEESFVPAEVYKALMALAPDVFGIYLLGHLKSQLSSTVLVQVYPLLQSVQIDLTTYCTGSTQRNYIDMKKGLTTDRQDGTTNDSLTLIPPKR